jgi:protein involved in polysaccharide export with SLBB domain
MFMLSKRTLFIICGLCIPFVMHAQQPGEIATQDPEMAELEKERIRLELEAEKASLLIEQNRINEELQLARYFGYKYFNPAAAQAGEQAAADNLPVPTGYVLGPGDNVMVILWGDSKLQTSITIDRDGRYFAADIDKWLYLSGKTVEEAEQYLRHEFQEAYATLKGPKPTTFMDVSLGTLKSLTVQIVGEVASPGVYTVPPFSTVGTSLLSAGGITITGSLRDVRVLRDSEIVNSIDYYKLFLEGQSNTDFRILNGDVIFVPVRISTVEISGEVSRPGIYELLPGEYIDQLISYAGGLKPTSGLTVELKRIIERGERESDDDAVTVSYLDVKSLNPHEVMDGDNIWIRNIMEVSRQVYISGQVKRPGVYAYTDSLRLLDLLKMAGGVEDEDFLKSVNLGQLDITRRDIDSDYSEIITLKLAEVISGSTHDNILLNNHDQVTVYPNQRYFPAKTVTLSGEVLLPGVYPIQKDFETIGSIIARSGGFTPRAFENGIILMREGVRLVIEGMENTVADGDIITIPEMTDVVEVRGSVYNPGLINFSIGRSVSQYIRLAGGITPDANKNDLIVIYANGSVKPKRAYVNPRPEPGCIIQVNSRPLLTPTQQLLSFVEGISTTLTQLITTYILVTQIGGILGGG